MLNLSGTADVSQVYGNTNREVKMSPAELEAREWASCGDRNAILQHGGAQNFSTYISGAKCLSGDSIELFRGQAIKCAEPKPPGVERMGPLPSHLTPGEGRYHRPGQRVLYLGSSEDGCRRELGQWYKTGGSPWIIKLRLPLNSFRIADFIDWPIDHFVTAAFCQAEMCKVPERNGPDNYVFSQVVSDLISAHFDGMRIPGVRGQPGAHYSNIVLFQNLTDWPHWVGAETAYVLPEWTAVTLAHRDIAIAAYYIWEKDNRVHGSDRFHWCLGEDELRRHVLGV